VTKEDSLASPPVSLLLPHCYDNGYLPVGGFTGELADPLAEGGWSAFRLRNTRVGPEKKLDISMVTYYKSKVL
jgi:hypothetical protein